jgi:predicted dehydrogenase
MIAHRSISRRELITGVGTAACFTILSSRALGRSGFAAPSDRMNIAFIGLGCQGAVNLQQLSSENILALCDVDWRLRSQLPADSPPIPIASEVILKYPGIKRYDDWRVMFDELDSAIDAVVVCTPDHSHALAAIEAVSRGKHTYCEKPLAHSIHETRAMVTAARSHPKIATQTGLMGHASEDVRSIVEWVRDGAIGTVREVQVFQATGGRSAASTPLRPPAHPSIYSNVYAESRHVDDLVPIPPEVKWDLWLGPAQFRNYNPMYLPLRWRSWLDFGSGVLGDHGPHFLDPVVWALDLRFPESVEAETDAEYDPAVNRQTYPLQSKVRYQFPARSNEPPVPLTWYAGDPPPIPQGWDPALKFPDGGGIILGSKGTIVYGPVYSSEPGVLKQVWLLPAELDKQYKRPVKTLLRPSNHWMEWVDAAKSASQTSANWEYGGSVTQIALLGNIAIRHKGQLLRFDPQSARFTNSASANAMFQHVARHGWALPGDVHALSNKQFE